MYLSIDLIKWVLYNTDMDMFSALAEPNRRKILELLAREGSLTATEIAERFSISPPAISQHLKVLREANLVHVERRAQQRLYQLNPEVMVELEEWVKHLKRLWNQRYDAFEKVLEAEKQKIEKDQSEREEI